MCIMANCMTCGTAQRNAALHGAATQYTEASSGRSSIGNRVERVRYAAPEDDGLFGVNMAKIQVTRLGKVGGQSGASWASSSFVLSLGNQAKGQVSLAQTLAFFAMLLQDLRHVC